MSTAGGNPSVSVGGNVTGSIIQTGNHNQATLTQVQPPPAAEVDVHAEIAALREMLERLATPDTERKIKNGLDEASDEAAKPVPDKAELAGALERAVRFSKGAAEFSDNAGKIGERVVRIAGWLGPAAQGLLGLMGLTV